MSAINSSQKRKGSQSKSGKSDHCPTCKESADGNALHCDLCLQWFHSDCVGLDENAFNVLSRLDQLWLCPTCNPVGKKLLRVEQKISILENRFELLEQKFLTKFDELTKIMEIIQAVPENKDFSKNCDVNKIVVDAVRDALEADSKKYVAVLENFPTENDATLDNDVKLFIRKSGFDTSKITNTRRSGPVIKSRRTGDDLPRIIKVKCDSETSRNELVRAVAKYADRGKVSKVYARPDRTWQQREKLRRLHHDLDDKRAAGENYWFIDRNVYELKRDNRKFLPRP